MRLIREWWHDPTTSWPGIASPKDGVASLAYVPAITPCWSGRKDVEARDKPGMTWKEWRKELP